MLCRYWEKKDFGLFGWLIKFFNRPQDILKLLKEHLRDYEA